MFWSTLIFMEVSKGGEAKIEHEVSQGNGILQTPPTTTQFCSFVWVHVDVHGSYRRKKGKIRVQVSHCLRILQTLPTTTQFSFNLYTHDTFASLLILLRVVYPSPFTLHPSSFTLHPSPFTLHLSPFSYRFERKGDPCYED